MQLGLLGFPHTGKTTLFELLTGGAPAEHAPAGEPHVGMARIPDVRLERLAAIYQPRRVTAVSVECLDFAGMQKGEATRVLPLERLRTTDALLHVVRAFGDATVPHVEGDIDPARDWATMETELILADHTVAQRRVEKLEVLVKKAHREEDQRELELLRRCLEALERETPLRALELTEDEERRLRGFTFLSRKPLLVVINADETDLDRVRAGPAAFGLDRLTARARTAAVAVAAKIELEIARLGGEDAAAFRRELGLEEQGRDRVLAACLELLGRIRFYTANEQEVRAWAIPRGTCAQDAAAAVHTDMARGFIRAEVVPFDTLDEAGSWGACRRHGLVRLEGKEYRVQDGDVILFRFHV